MVMIIDFYRKVFFVKVVYNDLFTEKETEGCFTVKSIGNYYRLAENNTKEKCGNCRYKKGVDNCKKVGDDSSSASKIEFDHVCDLRKTRTDMRTIRKGV